MNELYNRACRGIIAPSKFTHQISKYCPHKQNINGRLLERVDFQARSHQGKILSCVILKEVDTEPQNVILYLHGNGGTKLECLGFVPFICENRIAVVGFDFVGCGNSDHGFLTYGVNESIDAENVIQEAKKYIKINKLAVWGRSMGAATAIIFTESKKINVQYLILDCPFQDLSKLIARVIKKQTLMPQSLCAVASYILSHGIDRQVQVQFFGINYLQIFKNIPKTIPTIFFYSKKDDIVPKEQVFAFYNECRGHKKLVQMFEQHEEERSRGVFEEGIQWSKAIPEKKNNKLKLSQKNVGLQIQSFSVKAKKGFFCC